MTADAAREVGKGSIQSTDSCPGERAGGALSDGAVSQAIRTSHHAVGHLAASRQDWRTPIDLWERLDAEFHFTIDLAASDDSALCPRYYTEADDALVQDWSGEVGYLNCPYSRIAPWVEKAAQAAQQGATIVMLIPASTDARYWHRWIFNQPNVEVRFLPGRLRFAGAAHVAPFASAVVVFWPWGVLA